MDIKLLKRFYEKVRVGGDCHLWEGSCNWGGYGQISIKCKKKLVHRVIYELNYGVIPEGLVIDHLCRVRNCVNVLHLEVVTQQENTLRGSKSRGFTPRPSSRKTHCVNGHELTPDNVYKYGTRRQCRLCCIANTLKSNELRKEKARTKKKNRTHCKHGHEYDEENKVKLKGRRCKSCEVRWSKGGRDKRSRRG